MGTFTEEINPTYLEKTVGYMIYYISIAIFCLLSSILSRKIGRKLRTYVWISIALFCTVISMLPKHVILFIIYAFLSGLSFGFGLPPSLGFFADYTTTQSRGRASAAIFFVTNLILVPLAITTKEVGEILLSIISFTLLSITSILFSRFEQREQVIERRISIASIVLSKPFLFYFISSCIFCLIDALETPILENFLNKSFGRNFRDIILSIETIITAFSAVAAGFLVDFYGRKKIIIYGFVASGIAYATVGTVSFHVASWYLYAVIDGIALGFFAVILIFTVWGDLSSPSTSEKYYAVGSLPFFIVGFLLKIVVPYVEVIPVNAAFSFASFFLFLAVLPLMYAPETLPEKEIRRRELKKYVEKAKKLREKYEKGED